MNEHKDIIELRKKTVSLLKKNHIKEESEKELYEYVLKNENEKIPAFIDLYLHLLYNKTLKKYKLSDTRTDLCPEKWSLLESVRTADIKKIRKEGLYTCTKCKSKYTEYTEQQRRSADEPMHVLVVCLDCNNKWGF